MQRLSAADVLARDGRHFRAALARALAEERRSRSPALRRVCAPGSSPQRSRVPAQSPNHPRLARRRWSEPVRLSWSDLTPSSAFLIPMAEATTKPRSARPRGGAEVELTVDSFAQGGNGVARLDGYVLFVRGAVRGDRGRAVVTKSKRDYGEARPVEVIEPSPERIEPK